jgi:threonine dehydrogenase-like Zn-dependent dehydrogenase
MKAVVWHGVGKIKLDDVDEPTIKDDTDAIIKVTASSICGTDLHMVRGTMAGMKNGTILGHEAVGIVQSIGKEVQKINIGDRVVVCSTIACGKCKFCEAGEFACCDQSNPLGPEAGGAFFGGPIAAGSYDGLQAEMARIPYADTVLIKLPDSLPDEDAILCSDIFPTGYVGADMADVKHGDIVAVFGCGPVGQMAIASAKILGASKVIAVDNKPDRLETAKNQGAFVINYDEVDPVKALKVASNGFGPDSVIDAVGVDAEGAHHGPAAKRSMMGLIENIIDQKVVAPRSVALGDQFRQGDAPGQVLMWAVEAVRKSGIVSIIGVYPHPAKFFPVGLAMQKCLTVRMANCSHAKFIPLCLKTIVETGFKPSTILSSKQFIGDAIACYKHFDKREPGWVKVELLPQAS